MKYPALRSYKAAISDTNNINIPFFKSSSIKIFLNKRGQPFMSVGGFGAVFRLKDKNDNQYALKVFTRDIEGRAERYTALHDTLKITKFPFMVDFHYVADGLKVGKNYFPVVVMQWGSGLPLNVAIEKDLEDDGILQSAPNIAGNLYLLAKTLQEWNMGHGDFQEGNLLIGNDNRITLIDYDGMYVPSLDEKKASEMGLADYQHPGRDINSFGSTIDDFALISILFQLAIVDPALWKANKGDSRLILKDADYKEPTNSSIIKKGLKSKEPHMKALAKLLTKSLKDDPLKIDAIAEITSNKAIINWLQVSKVTVPQKNFISVIEKVVNLNNNQVVEFEDDQIELPKDTIYNQISSLPAQKNRTEEDDAIGAWDLLSGIFLEEEANPQNPGIIKSATTSSHKKSPLSPPRQGNKVYNKITSSIANFFFEDEISPSIKKNITTPQKTNKQFVKKETLPQVNTQASVKKTSPTKKKLASAKKISSNPTAPSKETKTASQTDNKQTPIPDWMKKRKRK